ncbi:MAG: ABC transporter permease [Methanosarcinales archaeon]|nr:MAG: ABC transporter permease [Methanosarcinales archaeon]
MIGMDGIILAYRNIKERRTRSLLTLLGIAVGIAAIISLIAVGHGMQYAITEELASLADTIIVFPGRMIHGRGYVELGAFTERDINDIGRIGGIEDIVAFTSGIVDVEYRRERTSLELVGGDPTDMEELMGEMVYLEEGRWIRERDYKGCVIGYSVAHDYFEEDVGLNDRMTINESEFVVVGIFEKRGDDTDTQVFVPMRTAQDVLGTDDLKSIMVRVRDINRVEEIAEEIEERINENHNLDDFAQTMTMTSMIEQIGIVFMIVQVVLVGIASIALIVGCIGIMNTMLMSVMERTHEIGIMKAIGATNRNIMFLFLMEAGMISLIGGILGCILGTIVAKAIGTIASAYIGMDMPAIVTPTVAVGSILIAVLVGAISGLYPARKAAKMSPIEAVRYE